MKTSFNKILFLLSVVFAISSCTEDMNFSDVKVTPVNKLYAPDNGKAIQLLSSATASLFFEWEASKTEDSGAPLYEVIFDKEGGDFSNPLYRVTADNMGARNYATISHKTLNTIMGMAGVGGGDTGSLIWTVVSSRGLNEVMAKESRKLTLTRLVGFEVIPDQVFITGEGSEGGTDFSNAISCSSPAKGEFEVYTKLVAGKAYQLISDKDATTARRFYIDGKKIIEGSNTATVDETAVYRINMDFNLASVTFTKITKLGLFFCPDNDVLFYLDYAGKGIWSGQGYVEFHQESWGRDQRYKLEMETVNTSDAAETVHWGPVADGLDSTPTGAASYFDMKIRPVSQWDNKWKFASEMDLATVKLTVYLTADGTYRHTVEKVN